MQTKHFCNIESWEWYKEDEWPDGGTHLRFTSSEEYVSLYKIQYPIGSMKINPSYPALASPTSIPGSICIFTMIIQHVHDNNYKFFIGYVKKNNLFLYPPTM